jgi:iron complex transport system substrate-binding protein
MRAGPFLFWILDFGLKNINKSRVVVVLIALILCGCTLEGSDVRPVEISVREVRDDLGRTVVVPERIERAVSLAPSATEMVFAVGAGDRLVGVTTYCNYPAEATAIEKIGDTQTPNVEKIIALKPQVVLVSTDSQLQAFSQTLEEQKIAVYVTNPKTLQQVIANLKQLGELFGRSEYADNVAITLTGRSSRVRHQASEDKPRVFIQISNEPLFTIGEDSVLTELVEHAGGVSVTKNVPSGYPKLSKETAAALDPDVIFLSDSDDNRGPNAAFKDSKAVRMGRVYRINADIISRPGPRLVDALEQIAEKLGEDK